MYQYIAKLIRVIDGDTVDALVDLGFDVWVKKRIRLYGINTPETRTRDLEEKKAGIAAKERLETLISECDGIFILESHGVGKYGSGRLPVCMARYGYAHSSDIRAGQ